MKTALKLRAVMLVFITLGIYSAAFAAGPLLLQPGYAVHTMGVSPNDDNAAHPDGNTTVKIYDTTPRGYTASRPTADYDTRVSGDPRWNIDTIGNVFGIAIDLKRNIYVGASANWSPGYEGKGDNAKANVPVQYGAMGGGETPASAGTVYRLDGRDGNITVFAQLPQTPVNITNQVCQGGGADVIRNNVGAGLGNIVYDKFHHQFFVSNFSDGKVYRLDANGTILDAFDTGMSGINADGKTLDAPYGLAVAPDGKKIYYGTIYTNAFHVDNYKPEIYAINLDKDGKFTGAKISQEAKLVDQIDYTQNPGGDAVNDGVWAAYADLDFTPDGDLLVGVRIGCKDNFATSYNHGGVVYLLKKDANGKYNQPSEKTKGGTTSYAPNENIDNTNNQETRAGYYKDGTHRQYLYDKGAIPLHPDEDTRLEQAQLAYGPDDGYGGVAVWQTDTYGDFDLYATSSDITTKEGAHGFMQFNGDFKITDQATIEKAIGYGSVFSSTSKVRTNSDRYDYKGIGGDVEVMSVVPMSLGSYVWDDQNKNGMQDNGEAPINDINLTLYVKGADGKYTPATDLNGSAVPMEQSGHSIANGIAGGYQFVNLPEGDYKVCLVAPSTNKLMYAKSPIQTTEDNNNSEGDSNLIDTPTIPGCTFESAMFTLVANGEPVEGKDPNGNAYPGDTADDGQEKWGNMTVDFGLLKQTFDLALVVKAYNKKTHIFEDDASASEEAEGSLPHYAPGEDVNFSVTAYNQGSVDAQDVNVTAYIPAGMVLDDAGWVALGGNQAMRSAGDIPAGTSKTLALRLKINDSFQGTSLTLPAEITSATNTLGLIDEDSPLSDIIGPDGDASSEVNDDIDDAAPGTPGTADNPTDQDDYDFAKIDVVQGFDLALILRLKDPAPGIVINPGDIVTFNVIVRNQGTLDATKVRINDYIPKGLSLQDDTWTLESTPKENTAVYNTPVDIPKDGNITIPIKLKVETKDLGTTITNWAEIRSADNAVGKDDNDSTPDDQKCIPGDIAHNNDWLNTKGCDDVDPSQVTIGEYFDLALIKRREGNLTRNNGDIVTFDIVVYNQGTLDATNVQVNDYIPKGLSLVDPNWVEKDGVATLKKPILTLGKGKNTTVTVAFKIQFGFKGDTITNHAEIAAAGNKLNLPDRDSTPASENGSVDAPVDNDISDTTGWDDYDGAIVDVHHTDVSTDTDEACKCGESDWADSMSMVSIVLMALMTFFLARGALGDVRERRW